MKKTVILVLLVFLTFSMAKQSAKNKDDSVSAQYKIGDIILADGSIVKFPFHDIGINSKGFYFQHSLCNKKNINFI